jgi:hypothetical protein
MEPTLRTGGLAFMRPLADGAAAEGAGRPMRRGADPAIRAGDITTFRMPRDPRQVLHRVTAVIEDEQGLACHAGRQQPAAGRSRHRQTRWWHGRVRGAAPGLGGRRLHTAVILVLV